VKEAVVNAELLKLVKRPPRTQAEKRFYEWLLEWKTALEERNEHYATITLSHP
jgi:hypothetical protein